MINIFLYRIILDYYGQFKTERSLYIYNSLYFIRCETFKVIFNNISFISIPIAINRHTF